MKMKIPKMLLSAVLILTIIVSSIPEYIAVAADGDSIMYGDVNDNGRIDVMDALAVLKHVVRSEELNAYHQIIADVDGSGIVDVMDALFILKHVVGSIDRFPVQPTAEPTDEPTAEPTEPTETPVATSEPTTEPTVAPEPTTEPTAKPTAEPTATPEPTAKPTVAPEPTTEPTAKPTAEPTAEPTTEPTATPEPTVAPEPDDKPEDILTCENCGSKMDLQYTECRLESGEFIHSFWCDTCWKETRITTHDNIDVCPNCDKHTGSVIWDSTKNTEDIAYYHYHMLCNTCKWDGGWNDNAVADHIDFSDFFDGCAGYSYLAVAFYDDGAWWDYDHPYEVPMPNHKHYECSQCGRRW